MIVKQGDTHEVQWRANMDLGSASVRLVARPFRPHNADPIVLGSTVVDAADGLVEHTLTGLLPVGRYRVELEATFGSEVVTFPNDSYAVLEVIPDLD